jgi:hypothetical protein
MPDQQQIAERILSLFTDREHASTIVGDLAETAAARAGAGFWQSVTVTAAGLAWRPAALILVCVAAELSIARTFALSMNAHQGRSNELWPKFPAMVLGFSAMLLSVPGVFIAARHGWRDPVARLYLALTVAGWTGGCLQFAAPVLNACLATFAALLLTAAVLRQYRVALVSVVATLLMTALPFVAIVMMNGKVLFPFNYTLLLIAQLYVPSRVRRLFA